MRAARIVTKGIFVGLAGFVLGLAVDGEARALDVGIGQSTSEVALAAGTEAATQAKAALGGGSPKLVLVFTGGELFDECQEVLEGVASVFDAKRIYGCSGYAPLTPEGPGCRVGVLALGGDVRVTTAVAKTAGKDDDLASGARIGKALAAHRSASGGRLVILVGDCHVPRNDSVAKGVSSVLGEELPVVGGAAFRGKTFVEGKVVLKSNLGILLSGDFRCKLALLQDNSPKGLVASARSAFEQTVGDCPEEVALTFAFDCGGRRAKLLELGNFPDEIAAMKQVAGSSPFFGFFGSGEIGCKGKGSPACGVGHHISTCAILEP